MLDKDELLTKWRDMTPQKRKLIGGGAGVGLILILGAFMSPPAEPPAKPKEKKVANLALESRNDLTVEQLAATVEAIKNNQNDGKAAIDRLEKLFLEKKDGSSDSISADLAREMRDMRVELDTLKAQKTANAAEVSLDDVLPGGSNAPAQTNEQRTAPVQLQAEEHKATKIRIIGGKKPEDVKKSEPEKTAEVLAYLPMGANFEGVLLNGMDAPTSGATKQNPVPALIRLDTDAILPNRHRYDVRECFSMVTGFGVLSTERAQLQTVSISCIKNDGSVVESKMEGYVVGEDGKVGLRGRLVSRQGQLLAKSFATGFFSALGQSLAPTSVPQLNVAPGGTQQFQLPNLGAAGASAAAQGLVNSTKVLADFYLSMAKEMFPIIEIDAMRRVSIVLVKGVELGGSNN